jgi:hypothetical protein
MMPGAEPGGDDANQGASSFPGGFLGTPARRCPAPGARVKAPSKGQSQSCDNQTVHGGVARGAKKAPCCDPGGEYAPMSS